MKSDTLTPTQPMPRSSPSCQKIIDRSLVGHEGDAETCPHPDCSCNRWSRVRAVYRTPGRRGPRQCHLHPDPIATVHNAGVAALDDLRHRLRASNAAPFLFVGSGLSRRYLNLDAWDDLLKRMAEITGRPYGYFASRAGGNLPRIASEIAVPFHEIWWNDPRFDESRSQWGDRLSSREGPLKVEVARYTEGALDALPADGPKASELSTLAQAVIDGVITTNYDPLLERLFPDFHLFVGQDELLFSDPKGVGEIYKIHGSVDRPESIVLTADDYAHFGERNPYLAAKLLTIFVEHPVVFLGYSLSDSNVTDILVSIARVLTTENLVHLRDQLIFVKWDPDQAEPALVPTQIAVAGFTIPVVLVTVSGFQDLFDVLAGLPRRFPARLLRRLKEHVYDLVLSRDPDQRLAVVDIDDNTRVEQIDVVFGVGVERRLSEHGYVGLNRRDLLVDALRPQSSYDARLVVQDVLPRVLRGPGHVPIYRYLRGAELLNDDGTLRDGAVVDERIRYRAQPAGPLQPLTGWSQRRAAALVTESGGDFATLADQADDDDVLLAVLGFPPGQLDLATLRAYLEAKAPDFDGGVPTTAWAKAVCLYDYRRYGVVNGGAAHGVRAGRRREPGATAAAVRH